MAVDKGPIILDKGFAERYPRQSSLVKQSDDKEMFAKYFLSEDDKVTVTAYLPSVVTVGTHQTHCHSPRLPSVRLRLSKIIHKYAQEMLFADCHDKNKKLKSSHSEKKN